MKSARQILLSLVHATQSLTQRVIGRRGIRVREPLAYVLAFALVVVTVGVFLRFHIASRMAIVEGLAAGLLIILLGGLLLFHRRDVLTRGLKQEEAKFRALLESAPDAMVIADGEGRVVLLNA